MREDLVDLDLVDEGLVDEADARDVDEAQRLVDAVESVSVPAPHIRCRMPRRSWIVYPRTWLELAPAGAEDPGRSITRRVVIV